MNTLLKLSPAIIILLIMIITIIKSIIKKNKNIPLTGIERLFLSSAQITISVIPDDVTDILKFACGTYSINNISK